MTKDKRFINNSKAFDKRIKDHEMVDINAYNYYVIDEIPSVLFMFFSGSEICNLPGLCRRDKKASIFVT